MFDWRKKYLICAGLMLVCAGCILIASANGRGVTVGQLSTGGGKLSSLQPKTNVAQSGLLGASRPPRPFKGDIRSASTGGIPPPFPGRVGEGFEVAQISVAIFPLNVRSAGARWRLGEGQFKQSDETVSVDPGIYRLQFSEVPGMQTPRPRSIRLVAGNKLELDAAYGTRAPVISTSRLPIGAAGFQYFAPIDVLNRPTSITVTGLEGTGLEFDTDSKVIHGTQIVTGTFLVRVTATNSRGSDERDFTLEVRNAVRVEVEVDPTLGRVSIGNPQAIFPPFIINRFVPVDTLQEITARPRRGAVFVGWTGTGVEGLPTISPTIGFIVTGDVSLRAEFVPDPFPTLTGKYEGALAPTVGSADNVGSARIRVSRAGAFTANLSIAGKRHALIGSFAGDGSARGKLKIRDTSIEVATRFDLDVSGTTDQIAILLEGSEIRIEGVADQVD